MSQVLLNMIKSDNTINFPTEPNLEVLKRVTVTASKSFTWEGSGLKLNVPAGAVKTTVEILIYVSLSGQFQFPKGCELVSAVYCIQENWLGLLTLRCSTVQSA